jgi:hypothetical protein
MYIIYTIETALLHRSNLEGSVNHLVVKEVQSGGTSKICIKIHFTAAWVKCKLGRIVDAAGHHKVFALPVQCASTVNAEASVDATIVGHGHHILVTCGGDLDGSPIGGANEFSGYGHTADSCVSWRLCASTIAFLGKVVGDESLVSNGWILNFGGDGDDKLGWALPWCQTSL